MTPEGVVEIAQRESLPASLGRRDWVSGGLRFFRAIGVVREQGGRYEALQPSAAAVQIERFVDSLTD